MELFNESMQQAFDASIAHVDEASILPPILYTSPEFYEFEKEAIFNREWLCVGRVAQIPNEGDWLQITLMDEPLLVVHSKAEQFHVLSAVCQHRGMVVAEGKGNSARFVCPYHHWCYAHDGTLVAAPEMDNARGFEKQQHGLRALAVEIWNGFIFATFNPEPKPLAPSVSQLTDLLENFNLDGCHTVIDEVFQDLPWNWKVMLENFNDGYHANKLHLGIGDHVPSEKATFLDLSPDEGHVTRINYATIKDPSFTPNFTSVLPVFKGLTDDERHRVMFALLPPSLGLAVTPDCITYFIVNPKSADKIDIHIGYCVDPTAPQDPMFEYQMAALKEGVQNFNVQDIWADTMVQKGLQSRFQPHGRYSWQEKTMQQFNCWLVKRYREVWPK